MQRATALASDNTPLRRAGGARAAPPPPPPRRGWVFLALQALMYYLIMGLLCQYWFGESIRLGGGLTGLFKPVSNALYRWRTGADAQGWLPCDGRCDWGVQRRYVNGREQTRRCYGSGFITADGECIMAS